MTKKLNNIDKYIVIDCRYSEFKWLKENVFKELNNIFDLSDINWNKLWFNCQSSLVVQSWDLWNKGKSTKEIALILNIGKTTVNRYLHKGNEIGKCKFGKAEGR